MILIDSDKPIWLAASAIDFRNLIYGLCNYDDLEASETGKLIYKLTEEKTVSLNTDQSN